MKKHILTISFLLLSVNIILSQNCCISNIYVLENKTTKDNIILRELPFRVGSSVSMRELDSLVQIATENLNNMSLFNYVSIYYEKDSLHNLIQSDLISSNVISDKFSTEDQAYNIFISVDERWYYWPHLSLVFEDRNMSSWLHNMDFNRITAGLGVIAENLLGLNHKVSLYGTLGFEKGVNFSYRNIALDKFRKHYLSVDMKYNLNKTSNYASISDKPVYVKSSSSFIERNFIGYVNYTYRPHIRTKHNLMLSYSATKINDTLLKLNPNYWGTSLNISHSIGANYTYSYEQRNLIIYPTKGYCLKLLAETNVALNYSFFYSKLAGNYQYYLPLSNRWFYNIDLKIGLSYKTKNSYIHDKAIGYSDVNVKGYDLFVIDGQHYGTFSNSLRFLILPKKIITINWLNWLSKFNKIHFTIYGKAIIEAGYAYNGNCNNTNTLSNSLLLGGGLGIDLLTYYDIILGAGYMINRTGQHNFIFSIKTPLF